MSEKPGDEELVAALRALSVAQYGMWGERYGVGWTVWDARRPRPPVGAELPSARMLAQEWGLLASGEQMTAAVWAGVLARAGLRPAEPWLWQVAGAGREPAGPRGLPEHVAGPVLPAGGRTESYYREGLLARPVKRQILAWCPRRQSYVVVGEQLVYELV